MTALTLIFPRIGGIAPNTTIVRCHTMNLSTTGCAATVQSELSRSSSLFVDHIPYKGIDDLLAKHIAHLFIRDPLVVFSETVDQDDSVSSDHFEVCSPYRHFAPQLHTLAVYLVEHTIHQLADSTL